MYKLGNTYYIMYICSMKKTKRRIIQHHISINKSNDDFDNYLVLVEVVDGVPKHTYTVPMHGYKFWQENHPFYVFNDN